MKNLFLVIAMFTCSVAVSSEKIPVLQSPYNVIAPVLGSDPSSGDRYPGQIYFNSSDDAFKAIDNDGDVRVIETDRSTVTYAAQFSGGTPTTNCNSGSTCTIESEVGSWLSGVDRDGVGVYALQVDSGVFSARPSCTCSATDIGDGTRSCAQSVGGSASEIFIYTMDNSFTVHDTVVDVICVGTR